MRIKPYPAVRSNSKRKGEIVLSEEGRPPKTLYKPSSNKPMQIVVFGSGSGTNLEALLRAQKDCCSFEVKALFTDRLCQFHEIAEREHIPLIYNSFVKFFKERGVEDKQNYQTRAEFDTTNLHLLEACATDHSFSIDMIYLAGYMRMLYPPILDRFRDKIINVHPADLTIKDAKGNRLYVGPNTVYDALMNGEAYTRSSIILVDAKPDTGPILVSSEKIPYTEGYPVSERKAAIHQEKQKTLGDWPASITALRLSAMGRISIDEEGIVYVDNTPQPTGGLCMGSALTPC